ncbi:10167_t:CDS:2 [Scutellospora calospora]|uniref:10167_t:CDS:1 n=1 Tax=Scutellospora calospora TaxID=85575 RepID=A0ACA9JTR7_9GLOM|nr:10167_t:CDS:2 [Scutellospora calospora]
MNDEENTKGIKKLETFFQPSSLTTSCQESYTSASLSLCPSSIIIPDSSLLSTENLRGYMAKCIRIWGNYFIKIGELLPYCQSKHTKLESLIDDEDFSEDSYIKDTLFPKLIGHIKEDTISERTCRNYMYSWGFKYDERRKCIFFDSHERPDMVLNLEEKEYVQITHDECYFYTNDEWRRIWIQKGENILHPKHLRHSIIVSAFLCPCYGLLRLTDQQLYENLYIKDKETFVIRSVQVDGYWKAEHMLEQLVNKVIPVFEILHFGCIGIFCFDQSTNHNAIAEDALITKRMNLSSGKKQLEELRDKQKGLRQVLEERKLWPAEKGFTKQEARRLCNYNYKDLVNLVPEVLKRLKGVAAEWAVNQYKSHRRIPKNIEQMME